MLHFYVPVLLQLLLAYKINCYYIITLRVQEFHVAYIFIKMANSPRPGVFALERSQDYGETWQAWQYFADTPADCEQFFGDSGYSTTITRDDSVICATHYSSVVPLEGGEVTTIQTVTFGPPPRIPITFLVHKTQVLVGEGVEHMCRSAHILGAICPAVWTHTHTHTQPFYCWSGKCPGPPGSAGTRKVKPRRLKPIWIY